MAEPFWQTSPDINLAIRQALQVVIHGRLVSQPLVAVSSRFAGMLTAKPKSHDDSTTFLEKGYSSTMVTHGKGFGSKLPGLRVGARKLRGADSERVARTGCVGLG